MDAAQRFFTAALALAGQVPTQVTTAGHDAYPRAIRATRGDGVTQRCGRYENNQIEQDRWGVNDPRLTPGACPWRDRPGARLRDVRRID